MVKMILLGLLMVGLWCMQSCTTVASTGASAFYNHDSLEKSATDQYITMRAYQAIDIDSDQFKDANVNVATFNRIVLLSGQVPQAWQKSQAEELVKRISGIEKIYNLITVERSSSQLARLHDAWITTKVKSKLFISKDFDASLVKVVTENRTVYLMGIVRPKVARIAVDAASSTDGVVSVVKIFSYLNLSKFPNEREEG